MRFKILFYKVLKHNIYLLVIISHVTKNCDKIWTSVFKGLVRPKTLYTQISWIFQILWWIEMYSESSRKSKSELFSKMFCGFQLLTVFAKRSILDVQLGSEYVSNKDPKNKTELYFRSWILKIIRKEVFQASNSERNCKWIFFE